MTVLDGVARKLGVAVDDPEIAEVEKDVDPGAVLEALEEESSSS
jgi:hypothetical protein